MAKSREKEILSPRLYGSRISFQRYFRKMNGNVSKTGKPFEERLGGGGPIAAFTYSVELHAADIAEVP